MIPSLAHPHAGARVHLVTHRLNGTLTAYQTAGALWRLWVTLDDGSTVAVGAHEARYVDADGRPGALVMPPPAPPPSADGADPGAPYRAALALAERILTNQPTHGSVQLEAKRLAATVVDLTHLVRGLVAGDASAIAHARALFNAPSTPPSNPALEQGVTTDG